MWALCQTLHRVIDRLPLPHTWLSDCQLAAKTRALQPGRPGRWCDIPPYLDAPGIYKGSEEQRKQRKASISVWVALSREPCHFALNGQSDRFSGYGIQLVITGKKQWLYIWGNLFDLSTIFRSQPNRTDQGKLPPTVYIENYITKKTGGACPDPRNHLRDQKIWLNCQKLLQCMDSIELCPNTRNPEKRLH